MKFKVRRYLPLGNMILAIGSQVAPLQDFCSRVAPYSVVTLFLSLFSFNSLIFLDKCSNDFFKVSSQLTSLIFFKKKNSQTGLRKGDSTVTLISSKSFSASFFLVKYTLISCLAFSKALIKVLTPIDSKIISFSKYSTLVTPSTTLSENFLSPKRVSSRSNSAQRQLMVGLAVYISELTKNLIY